MTCQKECNSMANCVVHCSHKNISIHHFLMMEACKYKIPKVVYNSLYPLRYVWNRPQYSTDIQAFFQEASYVLKGSQASVAQSLSSRIQAAARIQDPTFVSYSWPLNPLPALHQHMTRCEQSGKRSSWKLTHRKKPKSFVANIAHFADIQILMTSIRKSSRRRMCKIAGWHKNKVTLQVLCDLSH